MTMQTRSSSSSSSLQSAGVKSGIASVPVAPSAATEPTVTGSSTTTDSAGVNLNTVDSSKTNPRPIAPVTTASTATKVRRMNSTGRAPGAHQRPMTWQRVVKGAVATVLWMFLSSAVILLNKNLYRMGFPYPCAVTGMGQVFSVFAGLALAHGGFLPLRPPPPLRSQLSSLLPIVVCSSATMFFGNYSYLHLSVAFIQILKAFTPALTLVFCCLSGLEAPSAALAASVGLIALGTAGAVLVESGTPAFHTIGFLSFMLSSVSEAGRVVGTEVLQGGRAPYNTAEALVYVGGPTAATLLLASAVWEVPSMLRPTLPNPLLLPGGGVAAGASSALPQLIPPLALVGLDPLAFLSASSVSALVNMSCFFAIQLTSSLTFKVAGCAKNMGLVWYSVVRHGEQVSLLQVAGYGVSVAGFALYSRLKLMTSSAPSTQSQPPTMSSPSPSAAKVAGLAASAAVAAGSAAAGAAAAAAAGTVGGHRKRKQA